MDGEDTERNARLTSDNYYFRVRIGTTYCLIPKDAGKGKPKLTINKVYVTTNGLKQFRVTRKRVLAKKAAKRGKKA